VTSVSWRRMFFENENNLKSFKIRGSVCTSNFYSLNSWGSSLKSVFLPPVVAGPNLQVPKWITTDCINKIMIDHKIIVAIRFPRAWPTPPLSETSDIVTTSIAGFLAKFCNWVWLHMFKFFFITSVVWGYIIFLRVFVSQTSLRKFNYRH